MKNTDSTTPMNIEMWPTARPIPYAANARKLNARAVDTVAASLKEFGWRQPIVVDTEGVIVVGHTRLLGAKKLGLENVPVHVASELTPAQIKAYRLMDNRSSDNSEWDLELLEAEMAGLVGELDVALTGFSDRELAKLAAASARIDEDEVPVVPDVPTSALGDLWILGKHRLLCGDSTVAADVANVLGDAKPLLMVTDPPYGVSYDADWRNRADRANGKPYGARAIGKVENDSRSDWREAWALFPGDVAYVWHAGIYAGTVADSLVASEFQIRAQVIWAKQQFAISRGHYHWQHEPCWYAVRKNGTGHWSGDRKQTTLWQIDKPMKSETGHSTQKPVECMRRPVINNSLPGDAVYEPFCGSGSTIIACETEGRTCLAIELDPKYIDVIIARWELFTGKTATLDGATFAEVKAKRGGRKP